MDTPSANVFVRTNRENNIFRIGSVSNLRSNIIRIGSVSNPRQLTQALREGGFRGKGRKKVNNGQIVMHKQGYHHVTGDLKIGNL